MTNLRVSRILLHMMKPTTDRLAALSRVMQWTPQQLASELLLRMRGGGYAQPLTERACVTIRQLLELPMVPETEALPLDFAILVDEAERRAGGPARMHTPLGNEVMAQIVDVIGRDDFNPDDASEIRQIVEAGLARATAKVVPSAPEVPPDPVRAAPDVALAVRMCDGLLKELSSQPHKRETVTLLRQLLEGQDRATSLDDDEAGLVSIHIEARRRVALQKACYAVD